MCKRTSQQEALHLPFPHVLLPEVRQRPILELQMPSGSQVNICFAHIQTEENSKLQEQVGKCHTPDQEADKM